METWDKGGGSSSVIHALQRSGGRGNEGVGHFMESYPSSKAVGDPFIAPKWRRGTKAADYILSFTPSSETMVGDAMALPPPSWEGE